MAVVVVFAALVVAFSQVFSRELHDLAIGQALKIVMRRQIRREKRRLKASGQGPEHTETPGPTRRERRAASRRKQQQKSRADSRMRARGARRRAYYTRMRRDGRAA